MSHATSISTVERLAKGIAEVVDVNSVRAIKSRYSGTISMHAPA